MTKEGRQEIILQGKGMHTLYVLAYTIGGWGYDQTPFYAHANSSRCRTRKQQHIRMQLSVCK